MDAVTIRKLLAFTTLLICGASVAVADEPPEPIAPAESQQIHHGVLIAQVDMAEVFRQFNDFKQQQEVLRLEVKTIESEIRAARKGLIELKRRSIDLPEGSEQLKTMNRAIETLTKGIQQRITKAKQELMDREAQLYFDCYQQVEEVVALYARAHGIRMVVRKQAPLQENASREQILKSVQRFVIFADDCDITSDIIAAVNR